MATKEELSSEVNEILGTELGFEEMKKDDLELFLELLDDGVLLEEQAKHIVKNHSKSKLEEEIDDWYAGKLISKLL